MIGTTAAPLLVAPRQRGRRSWSPACTTAPVPRRRSSPHPAGHRSTGTLQPSDHIARALDLHTGVLHERVDGATNARLGALRVAGPSAESRACARPSTRVDASPALAPPLADAARSVAPRRAARTRLDDDVRHGRLDHGRRRRSRATGSRLDRVVAYVTGPAPGEPRPTDGPAARALATSRPRRLRRASRRASPRVVDAVGGGRHRHHGRRRAATRAYGSRCSISWPRSASSGEAAVGARGSERRRLPRSRVLGRRRLRAAVLRGDPSAGGAGHARVPHPPAAGGARARAVRDDCAGARFPVGVGDDRRRGDADDRSSTRTARARPDPHGHRRAAHRGRRRVGGVVLRRRGPATTTSGDGPGHRLLVETARYWASRIRADRAGAAHLFGVIGPDEYHEPVDDDAYTNVLARWNLRARPRRRSPTTRPTPTSEPSERARWLDARRRARRRLPTPTPASTSSSPGSSTSSRCGSPTSRRARHRRPPARARAGAAVADRQAGRRADAASPAARTRSRPDRSTRTSTSTNRGPRTGVRSRPGSTPRSSPAPAAWPKPSTCCGSRRASTSTTSATPARAACTSPRWEACGRPSRSDSSGARPHGDALALDPQAAARAGRSSSNDCSSAARHCGSASQTDVVTIRASAPVDVRARRATTCTARQARRPFRSRRGNHDDLARGNRRLGGVPTRARGRVVGRASSSTRDSSPSTCNTTAPARPRARPRRRSTSRSSFAPATSSTEISRGAARAARRRARRSALRSFPGGASPAGHVCARARGADDGPADRRSARCRRTTASNAS